MKPTASPVNILKDRRKSARIVVVTASDDRFVKHLATMLVSLFATKHRETDVSVIVLDGGISPKHKQMLTTGTSFGPHVRFIPVHGPTLLTFPVSAGTHIATYFRLFLAELFDEKMDKVLYIDADTIVLGDLSEMWDTDVGDAYVAAVPDVSEKKPECVASLKRDMYFNAGVMLVNLRLWRSDALTAQLVQFTERYSKQFLYYDQDALNGVIRGRYKRLPFRSNVMISVAIEPEPYFDLYGRGEIEDAKRRPLIIHFVGKEKPWLFRSRVPFRKEYFDFRNETPWPRLTFRDMCSRAYLTSVNEFLNVFLLFHPVGKYRFLIHHPKLYQLLVELKRIIRGLFGVPLKTPHF